MPGGVGLFDRRLWDERLPANTRQVSEGDRRAHRRQRHVRSQRRPEHRGGRLQCLRGAGLQTNRKCKFPGYVAVGKESKQSILSVTLFPYPFQLSEKDMSMLEERIKRSAKKTAAAPAKPSATERSQREHPTNPNATIVRKPAQEDPNKLK